jgi:hypothetical protein
VETSNTELYKCVVVVLHEVSFVIETMGSIQQFGFSPTLIASLCKNHYLVIYLTN